MESFTQFSHILGLLLLVVAYTCLKNIIDNSRKGNKLLPPEPAGALPFIGHLHHLRAQIPAAKILGKITDDYGPIYSLRLGSHRAVVVSSWQMVKECFTTNDINYATRPNLAVSRYMIYENAGFALAPYGPYWLEIRKLVTSELFTSQRLEKLRKVHNSEVQYYINELHLLSLKNEDKVVDMSKWFEHVTFNIISRMLAGKRFYEWRNVETNDNDFKVREAIKKGLYLFGAFVVSDHVPNLEWMDIGGHIKAMKQVANELNSVVKKWFDEHVKMRKEYDSDTEADFMDVMLSTLSKDAEMFGYGRETVIKATTVVSNLVFPSLFKV